MQKTIVAICLLVLSVQVAWANDAGKKLINTVAHGQLKVGKSFDTPFGMKGYVVHPKGRQQGMVVYTDKSGKYMFAGNVLDSKGTNYTHKFMKKYVEQPLAAKASQGLKDTHSFVDGDDKAPHKMYVLIDPNCSYCHLFFDHLRPLIDQGKLQVRWIPVGLVKADSLGKSAALLKPDQDSQSVKLLQQDENQFDSSKEEGGIKAIAASDGPAAKAAIAKVKANNDFFTKYFIGTPVSFYQDQDGKVQMLDGYVDQEQFKAILPKISQNW